MLRLLRVSGSSLLPAYREGDFVLVSKIPYLFGAISRGDIVAFRHRTYGVMIKEVESLGPKAERIFVIGTQAHSIDSRHFGAISRSEILGKVIWHIRRPR